MFQPRIAIAILILSITCLAADHTPSICQLQTEMTSIPAGSFQRQDGSTIKVDSFAIAKTEVTRALWDAVWTWAHQNGYDLTPARSPQANQPIWTVNWFDAVKFCNALSEMQNLTPAYYTDLNKQNVYRTGQIEISNDQVAWQADGFRLPTEAEWEYAYRAGTQTNYYWGQMTELYNTWDPPQAPWRKNLQAYCHRFIHTPQPIAQKLPNAFGLFDMAGNVEEWCWDRYQPDYPKQTDNPRGADNGRFRVLRGGSVALDHAFYHQAHFRGRAAAYYRFNSIGFRLAAGNPNTKIKVTPLPTPSLELRFARHEMEYAPKDNTAKTVAKRFFSLINLDYPPLQEVKQYYDANDPHAALQAYRDWFFQHYKTHQAQLKINPVKFDIDLDFMMAQKPPVIYYHNEPAIFNQPSVYHTGNWFIKAFIDSGDFRYIEKYFNLMDDFTANGPRQYFTLSDIALGKHFMGPYHNSHWPQHWELGSGLNSAVRAEELWMQLNVLANHLPPQQVKLVPPSSLANQLSFIADVLVGGGLANGKECVPNQIKHIATMLAQFGITWKEFKDAPDWLTVGEDRLETTLTGGAFLPDGGDMEQSFGYNKGAIPTGKEMLELFAQADHLPDWLDIVTSNSRKRLLLFASIIMPTGVMPSVGEGPAHDIRWLGGLHQWDGLYNADLPRKVLKQIDPDNTPGDPPAPAFESIAFPYSGYYVQRRRWDKQGAYLFFKSTRSARGHTHMDDNGLALIAYGRHLLVDGGGVPYGHRFLPDHQKIDTPWIRSCLHNSWAANTVLVDGATQTEWAAQRPMQAYDTPLQHKWHTSQNFDFVEGIYNDGYEKIYEGPSDVDFTESVKLFGNDIAKYGDITQQIPIIEKLRKQTHQPFMATHHRQIIFLRKLDMWIVTDHVQGGSEYTQVWRFAPPTPQGLDPRRIAPSMPGFEKEQVVIDHSNQLIKTIDPQGANLAIYNFSEKPVNYTRYFGNKYPHRGWQNSTTYIPTTAVHAAWSGSLPIVAVLSPSQPGQQNRVIQSTPLSSDNTVGCVLTLNDQTQITYLTALEPTPLQVGQFSAKAKTLLLVNRPNQDPTGMAFNLQQFTISGQNITPQHPNIEFTIDQHNRVQQTPITVPTTFRWQQTPQGLIPQYHEPKEEKPKKHVCDLIYKPYTV